jgi:predicted amidohydrolase
MTVIVAAAQIAADVEAGPSTARLEAAVREAAARGAQLVVLPELAASGYCFLDAEEARRAGEDLRGPTVAALVELSAELSLTIVCGIPLLEGGPLFNAGVVVEDGRVLGTYLKSHLWGRESEFFTPGDEGPLVLDTKVGRLGVLVCYDLEFPELVRSAAEQGAELIAAPVNWPFAPYPAGERPIDVVKAQAAAAYYGTYVVVADRCGVERGTDWVGGSLVAAPTGYLLAGPATTGGAVAEPALLVADVDLAAARDKSLGPHNDRFRDRRVALYHR